MKGLVAKVQAHTLLDQDRLMSVANNAHICKRYAGDFAEFGVYRGGVALLLHNIAPEKTLHLFDTFQGIPEDDQIQGGHHAGDFRDTSIQFVRTLLGDSPAIQFHQGWFPLCKMPNTTYAFVHMDADTYQSTQAGLDYFVPRLVIGGRVIFDDYGWKDCPGVQRAIVEHLRNCKPDKFYTVQEARYQLTLIREK